jgi:hypothetical protein
MKSKWILAVTLIMCASAIKVFAQDVAPTESLASAGSTMFDFGRMLRAVGATIGYSLLGIVMSIIGFKLFDIATPFHLEKEIVQDRNMAVAVVSSAMILGVSIIVAFTILS